jgi:hypothetical protein
MGKAAQSQITAGDEAYEPLRATHLLLMKDDVVVAMRNDVGCNRITSIVRGITSHRITAHRCAKAAVPPLSHCNAGIAARRGQKAAQWVSIASPCDRGTLTARRDRRAG